MRGRIVTSVSGNMKKLGIDQLDVPQRLALIEEIWQSIDLETWKAMQLCDARTAELDVRIFDDDLYDEDLLELDLIEELAAYARRRN
jgi:putative addiction module component (TIGR02574 family)